MVSATIRDVPILQDKKIESHCRIVRGQLVALQYYSESMSKEQVLKICRDIISGLMDVIELIDDEQERSDGQ